MHDTNFLRFCLATVASVFLSHQALADEAGQDTDYRLLDPACAVVNEAYIKTVTTQSYSLTIQKVEPDGSAKPLIMERKDGPIGYHKYAISKKWLRFDANAWTLKDRDDPKFTDCRLIGEDGLDGSPTKHISAYWHKFPYTAEIEIWISIEHGRVLRTLRQYRDPPEFSSPTILETYNYDPASASPPPSDLVQ